MHHTHVALHAVTCSFLYRSKYTLIMTFSGSSEREREREGERGEVENKGFIVKFIYI